MKNINNTLINAKMLKYFIVIDCTIMYGYNIDICHLIDFVTFKFKGYYRFY
jgi:hypothetical protein